jgi:hypothetical protein
LLYNFLEGTIINGYKIFPTYLMLYTKHVKLLFPGTSINLKI